MVKRRLWQGDQLVKLTPKAFDTLLVLVSSAPDIVEKDDLLKAVWPGTFVEEATLAQNISAIRKALGDTPDLPRFLATVPRRGYRFLEPVARIESASAAAAPQTSPASAVPRSRRRWDVCAGLLALTVGAIVYGVLQRAGVPVPPGPVVFTISPPDAHRFSSSGSLMAVSPDGQRLLFIATDRLGVNRLWVRSLDDVRSMPLPGTEDAAQPFWSHDSRFVAFFADGKLKKVDIGSGAVQTICAAPRGSQALAGSWSPSGDILFASMRDGIYRVPAAGGTAARFLPPAEDDEAVLWPQFLPDGRRFLFMIASPNASRSGIHVGSLYSGESRRIVATKSFATYATGGYLLFVQDGTLVAQHFDADSLRLSGNPMPVADAITVNLGTGRATFSVSQNGVLAYRRAGTSEFAWFSREGEFLGRVGPPGVYRDFSLSPDERTIAASRLDPHSGTSDLWFISTIQGAARRITFGDARVARPVWSPDGSSIVFQSDRGGPWQLRRKVVTSDGSDEPLLSATTGVRPTDWSPDGQLLVFHWRQQPPGSLTLLPVSGADNPVELPYEGRDENEGRISPDGQWLAYGAWHAGWSVFVRPLRSAEGRWQLSSSGPVEPRPRWRADGKELFFLGHDLSLMAVDVSARPGLRFGSPRQLFHTQVIAPSGVSGQAFDVTADGQRFLLKLPLESSPITVVTDWRLRVTAKAFSLLPVK